MQINGTANLPVIRGRPRADLAAATTTTQPDHQLVHQDILQTHRCPPLFVQSTSTTRLSRAGEQAARAYQGVAMAGGREELANRLNETV
ncbi:MAG: hypothetical protein P8Z75_09740 [Gammaproteobacteria bacterium]|jgi:hypothetical protein